MFHNETLLEKFHNTCYYINYVLQLCVCATARVEEHTHTHTHTNTHTHTHTRVSRSSELLTACVCRTYIATYIAPHFYLHAEMVPVT